VKIFVFGSSITSSYWNGAATYYRGCYKYLARLGHTITFAEPNAFGRQDHRDSDDFSYVESIVYEPGRGVELRPGAQDHPKSTRPGGLVAGDPAGAPAGGRRTQAPDAGAGDGFQHHGVRPQVA